MEGPRQVREETTNLGPAIIFTDEECRDFAYICSCMPTDRMGPRDAALVGKVEAKFRIGRGAWLSPGQWEWFANLAFRWSAFIQAQESAATAIRELAARGRA